VDLGLFARVVLTLTALLLCVPSALGQSTPDQIHVSVAGTLADAAGQPMDVSQLVFHWSVAQPYLPTQSPRLKYSIEGAAEMSVPATLVGTARDYSPIGTPAEHEVLPVYAARLRAPFGVNVTYSVGEGATFSAPAHIQSLPKPTGSATIVALSHIGYLGYGRATGTRDGTPARAEPTLRAALNQSPDLALFVGQMGMSSSNKPWDGFMRSTQPLQSSVVSVAVPGEAETPENHHQLRERYVLPRAKDSASQAEGDETELLYHGFTAGPAYVIGLDSTRICTPAQQGQAPVAPCTVGAPDQAQIAFLHDTLEDLREDYGVSWIIVYVNHGPYMYADDGDDFAVRQLWAPLFENFNVDLVIHSNEAIYQRTHPLRNQVPLAREDRIAAGLGPVYVTTGTAGYSKPVPPITDRPPEWIAKVGYDGATFLRIDVDQQLLRVSAIESANGTTIDSFLIDKQMRPSHLPATDATQTPTRSTTPTPGLAALAIVSLGVALLLRRNRGPA
jgi:hypothetical protein